MLLALYSTCIWLWTCLPFQRWNSTAWLPSPTRLTPGKQTQRLAGLSELSVRVWTRSFLTIKHSSVWWVISKKTCVLSDLFVSPFHWSSARVRSSSRGPWRPASPPCSTGGHPSPQTRCSRRSLRSWRDRRRPAAGWRVWCPCGWSCGSALESQHVDISASQYNVCNMSWI